LQFRPFPLNVAKIAYIAGNVLIYHLERAGHYGTGDVEFTVSSESEFESVKEFISMAYNKVGG
jgi:predicted transport protein